MKESSGKRSSDRRAGNKGNIALEVGLIKGCIQS